MENLNPDFLDCITLLEKKSVEYHVVEGHALGFHGFPRYKGDIDFFVAVSETNAQRLMEVFLEFGFGEIGIKKTGFNQNLVHHRNRTRTPKNEVHWIGGIASQQKSLRSQQGFDRCEVDPFFRPLAG